MLNHAREYLARVVPWPQPGEPPAYVNIHWTFKPKDQEPTRKLPWGGRAAVSLDDAISQLKWASGLSDTSDIYVCMSTQALCDTRNTKFDRPMRLAMRSQENAVALKAFWFDMDLKEGPNGYATLEELVGTVGKFLDFTGLPKPSMMVHSGGGVHVYWLVDRALTRDEWRPLAFALTEAGTQAGLKFDKLSTDSARVLRIPETFNRKQETPRPVKFIGPRTDFDYSLERIAKPLERFAVSVPTGPTPTITVDRTLFPARPPLRGVDDLSAGIETAMPRDQLRACLDAIPNDRVDWIWWNNIGMRVYGASEGADYGLEEWQAWSDKNQVPGAKDSCRERWETLHHSPPTRTGAGALVNEARQALNDPSWVPYAKAVPQVATTPVAAAQAPAAAVAAHAMATPANDLPPRYMRNNNGIVSALMTAEDGTSEQVPVSDYPLLDPWLQKEPWILHFTTITERGRQQPIMVPLEHVGTNEMRKVLQEQGLMLQVGGKGAENIGRFFMAWIKKLQETKDSVASSPFGWTVKAGNTEGFVFGGRLWTPQGDKAAANPDPVLARQYSPAGDIQAWVDAAKLITSQGRPDIAAIVASAFGAPLVRFTGQPGVLMSAYSTESGIGKSTALKVAQAVWGDPIKAVQSLSDTQNSVMGKLGQIKSLPLYWDELKTEEDTRKFVNITFQTTQGKEKSRMTQRATQREPGSWQTLLVSASNDSLLDYVIQQTNTTTAGLYRIFEYAVKPAKPGAAGQIHPSTATLLVSRLNDNYGRVGYEYAKFLGMHHEQIAKDVSSFLEALGDEVKTKPDERFWLALIACICVGARYCTHLGFADLDEASIKAHMLDVLASMRQEREDQPVDMGKDLNVSHLLTQFLSAMRARNTLLTNVVHVGRGKPPTNSIKVINDATKLEALYVHVGVDNKLLRMSSYRLGEWLQDKGLSRHLFINALISELGMKKTNGRLGSGTKFVGGTEYLFELDLAGTPLANFIDEA